MELSRRNFLTGAAGVAGGVAVGVVAMQGDNTAFATEAELQAPNDVHNWEVAPADIDAADITETKEADVIIIGAGASGIACATSAVENGLSVIVVEKNANMNMNGGAMFFCNSSYQKSIGYEVDEREVCTQFLELMGKKVDQQIVWHFFDRSGECADWLQGILEGYGQYPVMQGIGYENDVNNCAIPGTLVFYGGPNTPTNVTDFDPYTCDLGLGFVPMEDLMGNLEDFISGYGAQIDYETTSERILKDENDKVTGIIASASDGHYVQYNANKAVVIAAGDYGLDMDMMEYYAPQTYRFFDKGLSNSMHGDGSGIKQALWIGAAMQSWPDHAGSFFCGDAHPVWNLNVNEDGVRFTDERTSTSALCAAIMRQKDCINYTIFDEAYATNLPYVPGYIGAEVPTPEEELAAWDELVEQGIYCKADTLDDLANQLGLDANVLKDTVEKYNLMCEKGEDTEFHKMPQYLFPVNPPYYGFRNGVTILSVHGGLHVDKYCHVLREDDTAIDGLYAIGLSAGDFWANTYTSRYAGISHGHNMTTGYLVGRQIAGLEDEI